MGGKPSNLYEWIKLGKKLSNEGNHKEAEKTFKQITKDYKDDALSWYNLGVFYGKMNDPKNAINCFETALKLQPEFPQAVINIGWHTTSLKGGKDGIKKLQKLKRDTETYAMVWSAIGVLHFKLEEYKAAEKALRTAVELKPKYEHAIINLGRVLQALKDEDAAAGVIREHFGESAAQRHKAFLGVGTYPTVGYMLPISDREIELAEIAAEFPDAANSWFELGNEQIANGRNSKAAESFRKASDADPNHFESISNLGAALLNGCEYEESIAALKRAQELKPDHEAPIRNLAMIYEKIGEYENAMSYLDNLSSLLPGDDTLKIDKARMLLNLDKKEEGSQALCELFNINYDPEDLKMWKSVGLELYNRDYLDGADICYHGALGVDRTDPETNFYIGVIALKQGRLMMAEVMLWQALTRDKNLVTRLKQVPGWEVLLQSGMLRMIIGS
ncbi:MAG: tetratricopeptide repeat protein [Candidatus Thorarchaeota archaeon]